MAALVARKRSPLHPNAEPNVIPFIDVLLVLLIIFMITAPKPTTDLRLDLATSSARATPVFIPPTIVELREDGVGYRLFVSGIETTMEQLSVNTLRHILSSNRELTSEDVFRDGRVYIRADLDVAYASVVAVTDTLQNDGFEKVSIAAQNADAE